MNTGKMMLVLGLLTASCVACVRDKGNVRVDPPQNPGSVSKIAEKVAYIEVSPPREVVGLFTALINSDGVGEEYKKFLFGYLTSKASGTAFAVHSDANGTWLATNQHVVEWGDEVRLSFDKEERFVFMKGKIIAVDAKRDLALVSIPVAHAVFNFSESVKNGDKVRAYGFPGGESYQITEGIVMQKCFDPSAFGLDGYDECLITHSATLNPGSSGGPLVSESGQVVGVNKASRRSMANNYYAIPAKALVDLVQVAKERVAKEGDTAWRTAYLKDSCRKFILELGSNTPEGDRLVHAISYKMIAGQGMEWFEKWEHRSKEYMFSEDPVAAMKMAILVGMHAVIRGAGGAQPEKVCEYLNPGDSVVGKKDVRIELKLRQDYHPETWWRYEQGEWRITRFDFQMPQHKDAGAPSDSAGSAPSVPSGEDEESSEDEAK